MDFCQEVRLGKWLLEDRLQRRDRPYSRIRKTRHIKDANLRLQFADSLGNFGALHSRHHDIGQEYVDTPRRTPDELERIWSTRGQHHLVAFCGQDPRHGADEFWVRVEGPHAPETEPILGGEPLSPDVEALWKADLHRRDAFGANDHDSGNGSVDSRQFGLPRLSGRRNDDPQLAEQVYCRGGSTTQNRRHVTVQLTLVCLGQVLGGQHHDR